MLAPTVEQIEEAIEALSPAQLQELYVWLDENKPHPFDARIERDLVEGRLDAVLQEALTDAEQGRVRAL